MFLQPEGRCARFARRRLRARLDAFLETHRDQSGLDNHTQLDVADLNDVRYLKLAFLARVYALAVDVSAVDAVQVLDFKTVRLEANAAMLSRAPDAIRRFLIFQIDVDGLVVGTADEIQPVV